MDSLIILTRGELVKLIRQPLTWLLLLALLCLLGLNVRGKVEHAQEPAPENTQAGNPFAITPEEYRQMVIYPGIFQQVQINFHLPASFLLLLALVTASQDFAWGTIRTVLAREPRRGRLLAARLGALAAVAAVYLAATWAAYILLGLWAGYQLDGGIDLSFLDGRFLVRQAATLARIWLVLLPVIALGLFVAIWARNAAISITLGGMVYFVAWMSLMVFLGLVVMVRVAPAAEAGDDIAAIELGAWGTLASLSPIYNMDAVVHWGDIEMMATDAPLAPLAPLKVDLPHNPWRGLALLAGYGTLSLLLARWLFWRVDVTV
jgi:ABC-2 type transport system permease protein